MNLYYGLLPCTLKKVGITGLFYVQAAYSGQVLVTPPQALTLSRPEVPGDGVSVDDYITCFLFLELHPCTVEMAVAAVKFKDHPDRIDRG